MSNEALAQGLRLVWFSETSVENGVPYAVQSFAGRAKVASEVEMGIAEDEVEREKDEVDVAERGCNDGLLNKTRALLSVSRQKKFILAKIRRRIKDTPL